MYDLRDKEKKNKKIKWWKQYWNPDFSHPFIWKNKYKILFIIILLIIFLFPSFSGEVIGTWIKNFFGNIIKYII